MDRTSWIAVIICFILLLAYGPVVNHLYPPQPRPAQPATATLPPSAEPLPTPGNGTPAVPAPPASQPEIASAPGDFTPDLPPEQVAVLENSLFAVTLTTHGGAVKEVTLKQHQAENGKPVVLNSASSQPLLNLSGWGGPGSLQAYTLESSTPASATFTRVLRPGLSLSRTYTLGDNYQIRLSQTVFNTGTSPEALPAYDLHLGTAASVYFTPGERPYVGLSWFTQDRDYIKHKLPEFDGFRPLGIPFSSGKSILQSKEGVELRWAAVKSQFFAVVVACEGFNASGVKGVRRELPAFRPKNEPIPDGIEAALAVPGVAVGPASSYQQQFLVYAGPKEDHRLRPLPDQIDHVMEFGWMGPVSRPLLMFMNVVHNWTGNYGLSIILLTIVVKGVLWWPQGAANRSMKRMAAVGPLMKEMQEKYKDDPKKLNEKMLDIYRDYGVNPVGGCLPMLIQLPVFLGFYYMLLSAIELRHAGFLWVADLSQPDTIWRLPIPGLEFPVNPMPLIMAATMYWSMQSTPQPAGVDNPAYKIMKFMPLIFLLFCYNFSSALSLYWTVQNLLSIVQIKVNNLTPAPTLEELKAEAQRKRKQRKAGPWNRT